MDSSRAGSRQDHRPRHYHGSMMGRVGLAIAVVSDAAGSYDGDTCEWLPYR